MSANTVFGKIISGGQTGADQGALDAALELGHLCGGWCPKNRTSEAGRIPDIYPLQEHASENHAARTEANVQDSDGTLIFTTGKPEGGTALTVECARRHFKPYLIIDLSLGSRAVDLQKIWQWGHEHEVFVLNVAGPRESKSPGIQDAVQALVRKLLTEF